MLLQCLRKTQSIENDLVCETINYAKADDDDEERVLIKDDIYSDCILIEVLSKDVRSANVALKSTKKETKETNYKMEKTIAEMESKLKDLEEFKSQKLSEEKELKNKIKKADKKLKNIQEREAKHELVKVKVNREIAVKVDDTENNETPIEPRDLIDQSVLEPLQIQNQGAFSDIMTGKHQQQGSSIKIHNLQLSLSTCTTEKNDQVRHVENCQDPSSLDSTPGNSTCLDSNTRASTCLDSTSRDSTCLDNTTSLDMIGLDSTCLVNTSMNSFTRDTTQGNSVQPSRKSLFPPWTCEVCYTDIPWGQTWEQVIHRKKHRDEPKD